MALRHQRPHIAPPKTLAPTCLTAGGGAFVRLGSPSHPLQSIPRSRETVRRRGALQYGQRPASASRRDPSDRLPVTKHHPLTTAQLSSQVANSNHVSGHAGSVGGGGDIPSSANALHDAQKLCSSRAEPQERQKGSSINASAAGEDVGDSLSGRLVNHELVLDLTLVHGPHKHAARDLVGVNDGSDLVALGRSPQM